MNTVTDTEVISRLVESEAGRKAAADIMRDRTSERMNLKATAEKLRRERGEQGRELADTAEVARQRLEAARKEMTQAEGEHHRAVMLQKQQRAHFDARIKKLERELLATAPAAINEFIEWLDDQANECKGTAIVTNAQKTDRISTYSSEVIKQYFSNAESLRERLAAIRAARQEAEALRGKVLDAADIEQRLDALRELPAVVMAFAYEK